MGQTIIEIILYLECIYMLQQFMAFLRTSRNTLPDINRFLLSLCQSSGMQRETWLKASFFCNLSQTKFKFPDKEVLSL